MERILIVNNNMHIGGVQKSLLNLLTDIHGRYDVTLLLFYEGGELLKDIPNDVTVISPASPFKYWGMAKGDAKRPKDRILRCFWAGLTRIFGRNHSFRLARLFQKPLRGYDIAISFLHSGAPKSFYGGCNEFVLHCVDARRKASFLHCDYEKIGAVCKYNENIYSQFDTIAACSAGCKAAFVNSHPQLEKKVIIVPNFQNYDKIRQLSQSAPVQLNKSKLNILTVARFGKEKGIVRAIKAISDLDIQRRSVSYRIIGDGIEYAEAKEVISKYSLNETVSLLGEMNNPYGYMSAADVLLIPSLSEAAPMVIGEAAALGTPILTTETSSAGEMVSEPGYGWLCCNSREGIAQGVKMLLDNPQMITEVKVRLKTADFSNAEARTRFEELINHHADDK